MASSHRLPHSQFLLFFTLLLLFFTNIPHLDSKTLPGTESLESHESKELHKETVRLIFAGDIMTHSQQLRAAESDGKYFFSPQFELIRPLLSSADIIAGNLEATFSGGGIPYSGYPRFNTPDSLLEALREAGFNLLFMANNHAMDYGSEGLSRTARIVKAHDFFLAGVDWEEGGGEILTVDVRGVRVTFLNYTFGSNAAPEEEEAYPRPSLLTRERIAGDIAAAKAASADAIIVYPHWGAENSANVTEEQRELARLCWDAGADIVVGAHPHVLQEIEIDRGDTPKLAAWSLGNFISSQQEPAQLTGVLLAVEIKKSNEQTRLQRISAAPIRTESAMRPGVRRRVRPAPPEIEATVFKALKIQPSNQGTDRFGYRLIWENQD